MSRADEILAHLRNLSNGKPVETCYFKMAMDLDGNTHNLIGIQDAINALIDDKKINRCARPDHTGNLYTAPYGGR